MQEDERRILTEELSRDALRPVLDLWGRFSSRATIDPVIRAKCEQIATTLVDNLRDKIRSLRNPILEGIPLSQAWPELKLNKDLDQSGETVALLTYRVVNECVSHFEADLESLRLEKDSGSIKGDLPVRIGENHQRLNLLRNLCALVGGQIELMTPTRGSKILSFRLPLGEV